MINRAVGQHFECASCGHIGAPNEGIEADEQCRRFVSCEVCCARHDVDVRDANRLSFTVLSVWPEDALNARQLGVDAKEFLRTAAARHNSANITETELVGKRVSVWLHLPSDLAVMTGFGGIVTRVSADGIHIDVLAGIEPRTIQLPRGLNWDVCGNEYEFFSDHEVLHRVEFTVGYRDDDLYSEAIQRMHKLHDESVGRQEAEDRDL